LSESLVFGGEKVLLVLTLILRMWKKWWTHNNASKWQMEFNSAFKGLISHPNFGSVYICNQESIYTSREYLNIFWNINYHEYKGKKRSLKTCRSRHKWCCICAVYKLLIQVFDTGIRRTTKVSCRMTFGLEFAHCH
jgi:hypothetical protein